MDQNVLAGAFLHSRRLKWILTSSPKMIVNGATRFAVQCSFCLLWLACLSFLLCLVWTFGVTCKASFQQILKGLQENSYWSDVVRHSVFVDSQFYSLEMRKVDPLFTLPFEEDVLSHILMWCHRGWYLTHLTIHPSIPFTFCRCLVLILLCNTNNKAIGCSLETANRGLSLLFADGYLEYEGNYLWEATSLDSLIKMTVLAIKMLI